MSTAASAIQGLAISRARAASASRNNSEASPVTPAVVKNLLAADFFLAGERDRGDAEADRIGGDIAGILEPIDDGGDVLAATAP